MNERPNGFGATISWAFGLYIKSLIDNAAKWTLGLVFGAAVIAGGAWYINNRIHAAIAPITDLGTNAANAVTGAYTATKEAAGDLYDAGAERATVLKDNAAEAGGELYDAGAARAADLGNNAVAIAKDLKAEGVAKAGELMEGEAALKARELGNDAVRELGGAIGVMKNLLPTLRGAEEAPPKEAP